MKTLTQILIIALLSIAAVFMFQSCSDNNYDTDASVLFDRTDSFLARPDTNAIKKLFPMENSLWHGYRFHLMTLSDVDFNPTYEAEIAPACEYLSNLYGRKDEAQVFYKSIDSAFSKALAQPEGKPHSSLYIPLAIELKRLSQSTARRRMLAAYSDLMENTSVISFYKAGNFKLLKENPDSVKKIFENEIPLPNLSGIEIHFVYEPKDEQQNDLFRAVSGFYKAWLENKGAKVNIEANLIL